MVRSLGGTFGYSLATGTQLPARVGARTGDWGAVDSSYQWKPWLGQSVLLVGGRSAEQTSASKSNWLVSTRGDLFDPNRKMRVFSASKWVSSTVIYSVIEDPLVSARRPLVPTSTPGDFIPWWRCDEADDARCAPELTLEKLMAFRGGLPSPGCENGSPPPPGVAPADAGEHCARKLFSMPFEGADSNAFDTFAYGSTGLFVTGLMALYARRAVPGHHSDLWSDLLRDYVTEPAGILPAPDFQTFGFTSGAFGYDYTGDPRGSQQGATPWQEFPGLSGSLACSPLQYGRFAEAYLSGRLVGESTMVEMTRNHGTTGDGDPSGGWSAGFVAYAQGMWVRHTQQQLAPN